MTIAYPAYISKAPEGGFLVQFVDLDEAFSEGETWGEAIHNATEVLNLSLKGRLEEGYPVPPPSTGIQGAYYIAPNVLTTPFTLNFPKQATLKPVYLQQRQPVTADAMR